MDKMVVDHACRLYKSVADSRANELEAALFEGFAHGIRFNRRGGNFFEAFPPVADWNSIDELPDVSVERAEFLLDFEHGTGVGHGSFNFEPVANDAGIVEQRINFAFVITSDLNRIEVVKCLAIIFTFIQDGLPAQSGLGVVEQKKLEQFTVVVKRHAPFGVVVFDHKFVFAGPVTSLSHGSFSSERIFVGLYNPGVEFVELAEVFHLMCVVAVEEYLMEAREAEDFLPTIELDLNRNDTST